MVKYEIAFTIDSREFCSQPITSKLLHNLLTSIKHILDVSKIDCYLICILYFCIKVWPRSILFNFWPSYYTETFDNNFDTQKWCRRWSVCTTTSKECFLNSFKPFWIPNQQPLLPFVTHYNQLWCLNPQRTSWRKPLFIDNSWLNY